MAEIIEQTNKIVEESKQSINKIPLGAIKRITDKLMEREAAKEELTKALK